MSDPHPLEQRRLDYLEQARHPEVYGPGEELPESGKKEPFFQKGGILTLLIILSIFGLHVWLGANGYGGIKTVIASFIFG